MKRFLFKYSAAILVVLCLLLALYLRVAVPYHLVFTDAGVRFTEVDAYAHMRLVDNTLAHFPERTPFDPYTYYPEGAPVYYPPLFTLFLSGTVWLFSFGSPTPVSTDVIGALFPAVLGALTVIPVFFLGRALFNRWAGVIAALLVAILPGEILGRTMLGFTDHHVIEILFPTIAMLFLVLALKSARQIRWKLARQNLTDRQVLKTAVLGVLAGLFLGLYLQMWAGGSLFVLILFIYFILQFVIDYWKKKPTGYLTVVATITMLVASLITLPFLPRYYSQPLYFISLSIATLTPALIQLFTVVIVKKRVHPFLYAGCLLGTGIVATGILYFVNPALLKSLLTNFQILNPSGTDLTIGEVSPLLFPDGVFSLSLAWANFTTGFFLSAFAFCILVSQVLKNGEPDKTLLAVWSLCIFIMMLGQRRFAYYYAIDVALLTGYFGWLILKWAGLKEVFIQNLAAVKQKIARHTTLPGGIQALKRLTALGALALVFIPDIGPAVNTASQLSFAPDEAWMESLTWLKNNSPPPFTGQDLYYGVVEKTNSGLCYDYPDAAYGVMAWWDYGNWITRIAHRMPNNAPSGGRSPEVAECLIAPDESDAIKLTEELGSRYIIIDFSTVTTKFHAVCTWTNTGRDKYFDTYYRENNGKLESMTLFYPEYYRTLAVRLYSFDGAEVTPDSCPVIAYNEKTGNDGQKLKVITDVFQFKTYAEVESFVAAQKSANYRIISPDPFVSPAPLTALKDYRLVYQSPGSSGPAHPTRSTPVKIFIYLGHKPEGQYTQSAGEPGNS